MKHEIYYSAPLPAEYVGMNLEAIYCHSPRYPNAPHACDRCVLLGTKRCSIVTGTYSCFAKSYGSSGVFFRFANTAGQDLDEGGVV